MLALEERSVDLKAGSPPPPWIEFLAVSYFFIPCERRITNESVDENRLKKFERKVDQTELRVRRLFDLRKPKSMRPVGCGSKGRDKNRPREIPMGCRWHAEVHRDRTAYLQRDCTRLLSSGAFHPKSAITWLYLWAQVEGFVLPAPSLGGPNLWKPNCWPSLLSCWSSKDPVLDGLCTQL